MPPALDPYAALGVNRSCDKAAIRRAYRRKAKAMHPDNGGSAEQFGALKLAHDVLMDETRRAKFDATGTIDETAPDNEMSETLSLVSTALGQIILALMQSGVEPERADLMLRLRQSLNQALDACKKQIAEQVKARAKVEKLRHRFKLKAGAVGANYLESMIAGLVQAIATTEEVQNRRLLRLRKALAMLDDYTFAATQTNLPRGPDLMASSLRYFSQTTGT